MASPRSRIERVVKRFSKLASAAVLLLPMGGQAAVQEDLARCAAIGSASERLACYDTLAQENQPPDAPGAEPPPPDAPVPEPAPVPQKATEREPPSMSRHWELGRNEGVFRFRNHKPIYILPGRYSGHPNQRPLSALVPGQPDADEDLDNTEAKFQLSFKLKMIEGLFGERSDLWLGYTQQSHWQVYNGAISRPFRETDYEPELMLVIRTGYDLFGLRGRFLNLGLVHQSNGRAEPLSRSWNRVYLQAGLERGGFGLYLRPWYRIEESREDDDNPDIEDYYGHGDIVLQYHTHGHTLAALVRGNVREGNGAVQLDWTFPLYGPLRGYVQGFTGYGESLIDYNHEQTTVGAGLSFSEWF